LGHTLTMAALAAAEERKRWGNEVLSRGKVDAAIEAYSEAICLHPQAHYYTNRAHCHKRKGAWAAVASDCRAALALDSTSIKAHYMLGLALAEAEDFEEATLHLRRAMSLTKQTSVSYESDIRRASYFSNRKRWEAEAARRLKGLEGARALVAEMAAGAPATAGPALEVLRAALDSEAARLQPGEVPAHFCCPITLEVMEDPVVTPYGLTYERKPLLEHVRRRQTDPVHGGPVREEAIVDNVALRDAIAAFLDDNPWAYDRL